MPHSSYSTAVTLPTGLPGSQLHGSAKIQVTSLCTNALACRPGDLFVAILDSEGDGHDDAAVAVQRGATAVLGERLMAVSAPQILVRDSREALSRLCWQLAGRPDQRMQLTAVAGSRGRVSTSLLTAAVLQGGGKRCAALNSNGSHLADGDIEAPNSDSVEPPELAKWLCDAAADGCDAGVIAFESETLAQRYATGLDLDVAILTSLRPAPLNFHNTEEGRRRAIRRVCDSLNASGVAILNADDPWTTELAAQLDCPVLTYGLKRPANVRATLIERHLGEQVFLLEAGDESIPVVTRLPGDDNIRDCLAAAAAGLLAGISLPGVVAGLESLTRIAGQTEAIVAGQQCGVFLDSARDPRSMRERLRAIRGVTRGKLICLLGAGPADDEVESAARGRVAERDADWSILTSDRIGRKASLHTLHELLDGYQKPASAHLVPDREVALKMALERAGEDDTVVVTGVPLRSLDKERETIRRVLRQADEPQIYSIDEYRN